MATVDVPAPKVIPHARVEERPVASISEVATLILRPLASLRLTVALFALSIFLIFVGTLAQKDHDIWEVLQNYFRVGIAWVELRTFERLVQMFAKGVEWNLSGSFPFPGGKWIGTLLLLNLFAAHAVRFTVAASGRRLVIGLGVLAAGIVATAMAIASGMNDTLESELSPEFCHNLWQVLRGALVVAVIAGANGLRLSYGRIRPIEWRVLLGVELAVAAAAVWVLIDPTARPDDSGMRILWQLAKGTGAAAVLLIGTILVFRKRAGVVLLHGGVALMMLSEMWTAMTAKEMRTGIPEGGSVNYAFDMHEAELAVIDRSGADADQVTVVPDQLLAENVGRTECIEHDDLPVDIRVLTWFPNADLLKAEPNASHVATTGLGREAVARSRPPASGVGDDTANFPAAYVELLSKDDRRSLGTYLVTTQLDRSVVSNAIAAPQTFDIGGRQYELSLQFQRTYWPFTLALRDFRRVPYIGTNTPKNYSSQVELIDPQRNVRRDVNIWMNNPLRYAGMTFYQSSFDQVTEKTTILQVVANAGWMAPYVGCMLVVIGMFAHFSVILVRFVRRQSMAPIAVMGKRTWVFPTIVVVLAAAYLLSHARMRTSRTSDAQIYEFGRLPVSYQGRIKPYDTLATHSLQFLSGKQELIEKNAAGQETKAPAVRWMLDVISGLPEADKYRVIRVENLDVLNTLGLEQRPGDWRYSMEELQARGDILEEQVKLAEAEFEANRPLSLYQRKVRELGHKYQFYLMLAASFRSPVSMIPAEQRSAQAEQFRDVAASMFSAAPHAVPPTEASIDWAPLIVAEFQQIVDENANRSPNPITVALRKLIDAYARDDAATFNQQLVELRRSFAGYEELVDANNAQLRAAGAKSSELLNQSKVSFEVFFNNFSPFYYCAFLYVVAFVLGALSWLGWTAPLRTASNWLLWLTLIVHTLALFTRIFISGRPPVTNLYSSAVFIGWGAVLLAVIIEYIYRLGVANIAAAAIGFATLVVAHFLSLDGDTMIVMQAVLDTQFWLATHVVCIALGYSTTYVAGAFGILYLLLGYVFPVLTDEQRRQVSRMIYGTLCFAILFSFWGTVLGGLWADDSWGRFWGWDPKENGALIIVLYNALVLHARWGAIVKERGLALLTIGGNIVVTWSWFGVNELGVGLHAYGASESSTAMWLLIFAASQLAIIGLGLVPRRWLHPLASSHLNAS
jgi:ABC-type transport system involved in cytochrome c biogenesis permease subunit